MCSVAKAWLQAFLAAAKEDPGSTEVPSSDHTTTRFPRENVVASTAYKEVYVYTFCIMQNAWPTVINAAWP